MNGLFAPLRLRGLELSNRIVVSPMCQYMAEDGRARDWHLVHYGGLAMGGAALLMFEATAVTREGRITPYCLGLWDDGCAAALEPVLAFCRRHGTAKLGLQLGHAGRKGSARRPRDGGTPLSPEEGAWTTLAPSALPFDQGWPRPRPAEITDLAALLAAYAKAAERAAQLGFDVLELHMAHGYLLHQFLSPLANQRRDAFGGSFENRIRFPLQVFDAVRAVWPEQRPLGVRVSATDWVEGGWTLAETVELVQRLSERGLDFVDVSSGGLHPAQQIPLAPGYQVPFAERLRRDTGVPSIAVGLITGAQQAEAIIAQGRADLVALARGFMDDPHWAWHAAQALGVEIDYPAQYLRAHPRHWPGAKVLRQC